MLKVMCPSRHLNLLCGLIRGMGKYQVSWGSAQQEQMFATYAVDDFVNQVFVFERAYSCSADVQLCDLKHFNYRIVYKGLGCLGWPLQLPYYLHLALV